MNTNELLSEAAYCCLAEFSEGLSIVDLKMLHKQHMTCSAHKQSLPQGTTRWRIGWQYARMELDARRLCVIRVKVLLICRT